MHKSRNVVIWTSISNRYNVYLQNVNVGVLRNLYDPDVFEAEFNVEGRITVGDQQYMKIPVKSVLLSLMYQVMVY